MLGEPFFLEKVFFSDNLQTIVNAELSQDTGILFYRALKMTDAGGGVLISCDRDLLEISEIYCRLLYNAPIF